MRRVTIAIAGALLIAAPAGGQTADALTVERLAIVGAAGGAAGWILGAFLVGGPLAQSNPFDSDLIDDGLWTPGIVIGFELGQAIGIPTAVHLANGRRGDLRRSLAASFALAVAGTLLLWTDDFDAVFESPPRQAVLIAVPVAQLISSIYFELRTCRDAPAAPRRC